MKKSMQIGGSILCLLLLFILSYQPLYAYENENPRYHHNVKIVLISRVFNTIETDGFHNKYNGLGFDENIILKDSNRIRLMGFLLIYNESMVLEKNNHGGWIHTKIEINGYTGWMKNQNSNYHLKMFGLCDEIIITSYR